jgi:hypothetical protein
MFIYLFIHQPLPRKHRRAAFLRDPTFFGDASASHLPFSESIQAPIRQKEKPMARMIVNDQIQGFIN